MFTYKQNPKSVGKPESELRSSMSLHSEEADRKLNELSVFGASKEIEHSSDSALLNDLLGDCCVLAFRCGNKSLGCFLEEIKSTLERRAILHSTK